ncbi:molybdopterin-dependent oxidoreductase [Desulfopila inferna]|uniref:molybdopterin-dependent oxidoreductase n=1 Tax=Desulfopila inferna TaxID=468528 RepID=UPI0019644DB9|nr:molybdopterin-dependent oxidoreductase [Desulfopila inferna]MBM9604165.1 molybdopterin-dependent oxidoreductase [Desulfopila inferna]
MKKEFDKTEEASTCPFNRRGFLKGIAAAGVLASIPAGILRAQAWERIQYEGEYDIFRNACPRNCYDTCSIKSYVRNNVLEFIEGAQESTFTDGALCVKGYAYPRRVYSPDRIKYPMRQIGRGTGNWKRISWDEAMTEIGEKILEMKKKDGSLLGMALDKYSGNFGITHYGVEGMMSSLGYTSRFVGTPCWPAGIDAQNFDMGNMWCNDPEDLVKAKFIIIWGGNPAWNSVHTMKFIYEAQERGAKLVVIDPLLTQTAAKADLYVRVKTSQDGVLALGMARHIVDKGLYNKEFVESYSKGFDDFVEYLKTSVTVEWAAEQSGVPAEAIRQIAEDYAKADPATIWVGYGLQRHVNGGVNVRAIDALAAMTGNVGKEGGGVRYGHLQTWGFNYNAMVQKQPEGSVGYLGKDKIVSEFTAEQEGGAEYADRTININKLAESILTTNDPPIRMLWVACKNPFAQDFDRPKLQKAFGTLEKVIVVDQFFNETVQNADIVLPTTTLFEEYTVNASYWHYWLSINEKAIPEQYEARSDLQIAAMLSKKMNELEAGSCTFPQIMDTKVWMEKEFNDGIYKLFGIRKWQDLRSGPQKAKLTSSAAWHEKKFATPSGKYEFSSDLAAEYGHTRLPEHKSRRKAYDAFRVLTPHTQFGLHSQFVNIDYMEDFNKEPFVYMHPAAARARKISDGDMVKVFNKVGSVTVKAKLTNTVAEDVLLMYEAWFKKANFNVQNLVDDESSDMGTFKTGAPGVAIHDQFADIAKA